MGFLSVGSLPYVMDSVGEHVRANETARFHRPMNFIAYKSRPTQDDNSRSIPNREQSFRDVSLSLSPSLFLSREFASPDRVLPGLRTSLPRAEIDVNCW
jgi:hypothetical protein